MLTADLATWGKRVCSAGKNMLLYILHLISCLPLFWRCLKGRRGSWIWSKSCAALTHSRRTDSCSWRHRSKGHCLYSDSVTHRCSRFACRDGKVDSQLCPDQTLCACSATTLSHLIFYVLYYPQHRRHLKSSPGTGQALNAWGAKIALSLLWRLWGISEADWGTLTTAAMQAVFALFADRALIYVYGALNRLQCQMTLSFPTFQSIWLVLWPGITIRGCHSHLLDVLLNVCYCSVISLSLF